MGCNHAEGLTAIFAGNYCRDKKSIVIMILLVIIRSYKMTHKKTNENSDTVRRLAALGCPYEDIAKKLQISSDTLVARYKIELDEARIDANSAVAGSLYRKAINGDTAAAIFWLKTRGGKGVWRETDRLEVTGADGGAVSVAAIDASKLDSETLAKILAASTKQ